MKVNRKFFAGAMKNASKIAPHKAVMPILELVRLTLADGSLTCSATDLEIAGTFSAPLADDGGPTVDVLVSPAPILAVVGAMDSDEIDLTAAGARIAVHGGASKYEFDSVSPKDAPVIPDAGSGGECCLLAASDLRARLIPFASANTLRPSLTGIYIAGAQAVATDGHRLGVLDLVDPVKGEGVVVPARFAHLALGYAGVGVARMRIHRKAKRVSISGDGYSISARLIDEQYPDYAAVMPKDSDKVLRMPRAATARAVQRLLAARFAAETAHVTMRFSGPTLVLEMTGNSGAGSEFVALADPVASDFEIAFNGYYLAEALAALEGDTVEMHASAPTRATLWYGEGGGYVHLLMPTRMPEA